MADEVIDALDVYKRAQELDERRTVALELAASAFIHLANALQKLAEKATELATKAAEDDPPGR